MTLLNGTSICSPHPQHHHKGRSESRCLCTQRRELKDTALQLSGQIPVCPLLCPTSDRLFSPEQLQGSTQKSRCLHDPPD